METSLVRGGYALTLYHPKWTATRQCASAFDSERWAIAELTDFYAKLSGLAGFVTVVVAMCVGTFRSGSVGAGLLVAGGLGYVGNRVNVAVYPPDCELSIKFNKAPDSSRTVDQEDARMLGCYLLYQSMSYPKVNFTWARSGRRSILLTIAVDRTDCWGLGAMPQKDRAYPSPLPNSLRHIELPGGSQARC